MSGIRVLVWNVEWARTGTERGLEIQRLFQEAQSDLVCVTEGFRELLPENGHIIESEADYGYRIHPGRRKVLLWSRSPWTEVDAVGCASLPSGRFAEGVTSTAAGPLRVTGVCIPWRDAHVRTGRCDRKPWEDHQRYLAGLRSIQGGREAAATEIVVGDFNQRIPRTSAPKRVFQDLIDTFEGRYAIATAGDLEGSETRAIDHVAHTPQLRLERVKVIPSVSENGLRLSDHFGLIVDLRTEAALRG